MTKIVAINSDSKIKLGVSTSVLFDMSEPDAVWRAEKAGEIPAGSYHRYMVKNIDRPLKPNEYMFGVLKDQINSGQYELVLLSKNSVLTGMRAIRTMVEFGIRPVQFAFTNGAPVAEYCTAYGIDQFLSSHEEDAEFAFKMGVASALVSHSQDVEGIDVKALIECADIKPLHTGPHLHRFQNKRSNIQEQFAAKSGIVNYLFDFDKVLAGPESDNFFEESGYDIEKYRAREFSMIHRDMQKGPWYRQYEVMMGVKRAFHKVHINTARGAGAAFRMFYCLAKWGVEPNGEIHCMSGHDKTPILKIIKERYGNVLFLDDGKKNIDLARKAGIPAGLVPSGNPKIYLGA